MLGTILLAWEWQPIISPVRVVAIAALLAGLTLFAYVRSMSNRRTAHLFLFLMRLMFVAALVVLLLGPSELPDDAFGENRGKLMVLLDLSESMLTEDCGDQSRVRHVQDEWLNPERLARLSREYDLELQAFDTELRSLSVAQLGQGDRRLATGEATYLARCVERALARTGPTSSKSDHSALLVISDGHDTEGTSLQRAATSALSRGIPVYAVPVGSQVQQPDVALLGVPMQEYLLPGEPGALLVKVFQSGFAAGQTAVRLRDANGTRTTPISFQNQSMVEVRFDIQHDEPGAYEYEIEVEPLPGEAETENNSQAVFCEVQRRRLRVLLIEGQPYWDTKFLAQALRKDERIELTQITQVTDDNRETIVTRVEDGSPRLPTSAEQWATYDVVALGRGMERVLDSESAATLADYVMHGGGHLVLSRGRCFADEASDIATSLALLEPVVWDDGLMENVSLELTVAGRASRWLSPIKMGLDVDDAMARLPGFLSQVPVRSAKPAAVVLATARSGIGQTAGASHPAIVTMQLGSGSVVGVLGEGSWRWSLLSPENAELQGFYETFWSNLVRWLIMGGDFPPGDQVSMQLSRRVARLGDPILVDVVCRNTDNAIIGTLQLTDPQGVQREIQLSRMPGRGLRYRATIEPAAAGVHRVTLLAPGLQPEKIEYKFHVHSVNQERLDSAARPMALQMLAEHSGGELLSPDDPDSLLRTLRKDRQARTIPPQLEYIWDRGWCLALLLIWSGGEWMLRRLTGLY